MIYIAAHAAYTGVIKMSKYEDVMKTLDEKMGNKDGLISLATITRSPNAEGKSSPSVRIVDAFYEDGAFYSVTYALSTKMQEIAKNPEVAVCFIDLDTVENFTASGIGENLGWVCDEKNAQIIPKVRAAFSAWYYQVNNEKDKNCCLLRVKMTKGLLNDPHKGIRTEIDFVNKNVFANFISGSWSTFADNNGSSINVKSENDEHTFSGTLVENGFVGANANVSGLIKKMSSLSFKVLGDGNSYSVMLPTNETNKCGGDHFRKVFKTTKDKIETITINIPEDLAQAGFGGQTNFVKKNIWGIQFQMIRLI